MIVLHAGCLDEGLLLWGEAPEEEAAAQPVARRRGSKVLSGQAVPSGAGADPLPAALLATEIPVAIPREQAREAGPAARGAGTGRRNGGSRHFAGGSGRDGWNPGGAAGMVRRRACRLLLN